MKSKVFYLLIIICLVLSVVSEKNSNTKKSRIGSKFRNDTSGLAKVSEPAPAQKELNSTTKSNQKNNVGGNIGAATIYERIREEIRILAKTSMSKMNLGLKKKVVGALSNSFTKELQKIASNKHYDRKRFSRIMNIPTKVYRFCVYPVYQINYDTFCRKKYLKNSEKLANCRNTFCNVCCDNLQIIYREQADNNILGEKLELAKTGGFTKISESVNKGEIHSCKRECNQNSPIQMPKAPLKVPRDPKLGKWAEFPGKSCADIKKWGDENNESGTYWIDLGKKGVSRVYCDMFTLRGGWTLFFNYIHLPNSNIQIKSDQIPATLKDNSHINLNGSGFNEDDIKQLRFFCTEKGAQKVFWHFMSDSPKLISAAFSGDQRKIDLDEFKSTYGDLNFPGQVIDWNKAFTESQMNESLDFTGKDIVGGFFDKPFGSVADKKFWIVKGLDEKNARYQCGTSHKTEADSASSYTHHTIWFKGDPPSEQFARARYFNKEISKLEAEKKELAEKKNKEDKEKEEREKKNGKADEKGDDNGEEAKEAKQESESP